LIVGIAFATTAVATTTTFAYHHRHHSALYSYGSPFHASRYGTYPSYTYDPDPRLRRQLRSDFNRGVDTPGNR
jgi:hypothetical protein